MDLAVGIELESPPVVVPWGATVEQVLALLPDARPTDGGAMAAEVVWLGGRPQTLRFFFPGGVLASVEAGGPAGPLADLDVAFRDLQGRLVAALGPPTGESRGPFDDRYPESSWALPGACVRHWVIDGSVTDHALAIERR